MSMNLGSSATGLLLNVPPAKAEIAGNHSTAPVVWKVFYCKKYLRMAPSKHHCKLL